MFHGSIVALVTPMTAVGAIDYAALERLVDWHLAQGTDGIVVLGTTGESPTVLDTERKIMVQQVVAQVKGRIPVIIGAGTNATHHTVELTQQALHLGADAALLVTPYYNKPTQEGLYQHYWHIAEKVPLPLILYNIPGRTACDMQPSTVKRLCQKVNNIVAIKETSPDLERVKQLLDCGIDVLAGDDYLTVPYMECGGKGVISVTANVAPKKIHELCEAALGGDFVRAKELNQMLEVLDKKLFVESNPIPVKWALSEMDMIDKGIRLPLTPLNPQYHQEVREVLLTLGLILKETSQ